MALGSHAKRWPVTTTVTQIAVTVGLHQPPPGSTPGKSRGRLLKRPGRTRVSISPGTGRRLLFQQDKRWKCVTSGRIPTRVWFPETARTCYWSSSGTEIVPNAMGTKTFVPKRLKSSVNTTSPRLPTGRLGTAGARSLSLPSPQNSRPLTPTISVASCSTTSANRLRLPCVTRRLDNHGVSQEGFPPTRRKPHGLIAVLPRRVSRKRWRSMSVVSV
mmetsp:Transcript_40088/g.93975  ORF Transcript_40088/g.93975 Transcript_40088/m.93975 type:complete len:216 (+) Transcript_40088:381-1028(+)